MKHFLAATLALAAASTCSAQAPNEAPRLVMAHYMPNFPPLAFSPTNDYWWNQPFKEAVSGAARPILAPRDKDHEFQAYVDEIRVAKSYGLDGFWVDQLEDNASYRASWTNLLRAAEVVGDFKIGLMPDYATLNNPTGGDDEHRTRPKKILHWIEMGKNSPALLRYNGLPVVAPYGGAYPNAEKHDIEKELSYAQGEKKTVVDWMATQGTPVAYINTHGIDWPLYQAPFANDPQQGFQTFAFGTGSFSPVNDIKYHEAALKYWPRETLQMGENSFVYYNTKFRYAARGLTQAFRERWAWNIAHRDRIRWMQIITWNDWVESAIAPSSNHFQAWQPLSKYFSDWFKTGAAPKITRDWLGVFHRPHPYGATQTVSRHRVKGDVSIPRDEVEAVAFLSRPAILSINSGGKILRRRVGAGLQSFVVPFGLGVQSARIERNGKAQVTVTTPIPVHDKPARENLWFVAADSDHQPRALPLNRWTYARGEWGATPVRNSGAERRGSGLMLTGDEFGLGNTTAAATIAPREGMAGVVAHARGQNGERHVRFSATRAKDVLSWQIARVEGDKVSVLDSGTMTLAASQAARLRLDAVGEHLIGFVNGKLVSSNVYEWELPHGRAGLFAEGAPATFHDIQVLTHDIDLSRLGAGAKERS